MKENKTLMQYFEWYLRPENKLWNKAIANAQYLSAIGITDVWFPPAYKGAGGKYDVGYSAYDLYDLGEFDQKGSIETKYGTKEEYINAIKKLHENGIRVYADIVLNHKIGADESEIVYASEEEQTNRNVDTSLPKKITAWTVYNFKGRNNKYSDFKWNYNHFNGTDWDEGGRKNGVFRFSGKKWDKNVDAENGNYDYLMGADIDYNNPEVVEEIKKWGKWYVETTKINGLRLDAVKHINADFYKQWLKTLRENTKKELFTVGEYWSGDVSKLHRYITETEGEISLFDVPLHYNLSNASNDENYDLTQIFEHTLAKENSSKAVTFVDNHDTQPGQALASFISQWFKQAAYSLILLRNAGYPCVFYGDFYGIPHDNIEPMKGLQTLIELRKEKSYGEQHDYFDNPHMIGWTREGDDEHLQSGLAVVISNGSAGEKTMYIGTQFAGSKFIDSLENCEDEVTINEEGYGIFKVNEKSTSVWVEA